MRLGPPCRTRHETAHAPRRSLLRLPRRADRPGAGRACADGPVSFRNEVMAVLSRGGCNAGACHGNQNGKNGFKLSLRGQDPDFDLAVLTRDQFARRTDRLHPEDSLLLLKPTAAVPHEGGKRFDADSREYAILAPLDRGGLSATIRPARPCCNGST